jgi:hypothetical protein
VYDRLSEFTLDEIQNRDRIGIESLIADKSDLEIGRSTLGSPSSARHSNSPTRQPDQR